MYIHDAINDYVTCGETVIVAHELGQKILEMNKTDPTINKTGFEQLFKVNHVLYLVYVCTTKLT